MKLSYANGGSMIYGSFDLVTKIRRGIPMKQKNTVGINSTFVRVCQAFFGFGDSGCLFCDN